MSTNPLKLLGTFGQSIWLDYIRRDLIESGTLQHMIVEDGLRGMTSNPAIFQKAIGESHAYDEAIAAMVKDGLQVQAIYEALSQQDVQGAADAFLPLYRKTEGGDGYVSLEVNPHLARDTEGTIREARRLWAALERPNVLIKVPGTAEGLPAIRQLISEGINVNVTLLFGLTRYWQVAEAYLAGIQARLDQGLAVKQVASVASFFVSRIDTQVDPLLESFFPQGGKGAQTARELHGLVAVASARLAYQNYRELFGSARFKPMAEAGARTQRLLWASTGTKNPDYSDVKYLEALIGPETINTAPLETLAAYRDHGQPKVRLDHDLEQAGRAMGQLRELGISIDDVTAQLEAAGVEKFIQPFDQLMETLARKS
jgi:transaldolase